MRFLWVFPFGDLGSHGISSSRPSRRVSTFDQQIRKPPLDSLIPIIAHVLDCPLRSFHVERSWTTSPELSSGIGGLRLSCGSHLLALNTLKDYASALSPRRLRRSGTRFLRTLPYLSNVGAILILSLLPHLFRVGRSSTCSDGVRMFLIVLPSP
jgi:hypothetical protein